MSKVNTNNDPKPMQKIKLDPPKQAEYTLSPLSLSLENRKTISDIHGSRFKEVEFTPTYYRYKYDWIEVNPGLSAKERKNVPWNDLLAKDRKLLGQRTLKGFFFPWKDNKA